MISDRTKQNGLHYLFAFILFGAVSAYACTSAWACEPLKLDEKHFAELEDALKKGSQDLEPLSVEWFESPVFRQTVAAGTREEFLRMFHQSKHAHVTLAGFHGLRTRFPEAVFDASVEALTKTEDPGSVIYVPVYLYLKDIPNTPENRKRLDVIEKMEPLGIVNWAVLVGVFDKELLYDWFHDRQGKIEQPWMAFVLSELYSQKDQVPSDTMLRALESCGNEPGYPRLCYLYLQQDFSEVYISRLRACLQDKNVDDFDIEHLVYHRSAIIINAIDLEELELPLERRGLIERVLEKKRSAQQ